MTRSSPHDPGIPPGRANSSEETAVNQTLESSVNFSVSRTHSRLWYTLACEENDWRITYNNKENYSSFAASFVLFTDSSANFRKGRSQTSGLSHKLPISCACKCGLGIKSNAFAKKLGLPYLPLSKKNPIEMWPRPSIFALTFALRISKN